MYVGKMLTYRKAQSSKSVAGALGSGEKSFAIDLAAVAVTASLPVAVLLVSGYVVQYLAGPAIVLALLGSLLLALFVGACYAELASRLPALTTTYNYAYVCIGEFAAFVVGWNFILEFILLLSLIAQGIPLYIDTLSNDVLANLWLQELPIQWSALRPYFDVVAFVLPMVAALVLFIPGSKSVYLTRIGAGVLAILMLFMITAGAFQAKTQNWNIPAAPEDATIGVGGIAPFGVLPVFHAAGILTVTFMGMESILSLRGRVEKLEATMPAALTWNVLFSFGALCAVLIVLTLAVPYHSLVTFTAFPALYDSVRLSGGLWICSIIAVIVLSLNMVTLIRSLGRQIYVMAEDGLIFKYLGKAIPHGSRIPLMGIICCVCLSSVMAGILPTTLLVDMISMGVLLALLIACVSLLFIRYDIKDPDSDELSSGVNVDALSVTTAEMLRQLLNTKRLKVPTRVSAGLVRGLVYIYVICCVIFSATIRFGFEDLRLGELWIVVFCSCCAFVAVLLVILISIQPTYVADNAFMTPWVPVLPTFTICGIIFFMTMMSAAAWIRLGVWTAIGVVIYIASILIYDRNGVKNDVIVKAGGATPQMEEKHHGHRMNGKISDDEELEDNKLTEDSPVKQHIQPQPDVIPTNHYEQERNVSEAPPMIIVAIANEQRENIDAPLPIKARTPSPDQSLDKIFNEFETAEHLTEKKEPNGKTYFVTESADQALSMIFTTSEDQGDPKTALALLDDIIDVEENSMQHGVRKISEESSQVDEFTEQSIVAMVHQAHAQSPLEEKGDENEMLGVVEKSVPVLSEGANENDVMINFDAQETTSEKHSDKENARQMALVLTELKSSQNDAYETDTEQDTPDIETAAKMSVEFADALIPSPQPSTATIPPPPVFDPVMYNTLGAKYDHKKFTPRPRLKMTKSMPEKLNDTVSNDSDPMDMPMDVRKSNIMEKLEVILGQRNQSPDKLKVNNSSDSQDKIDPVDDTVGETTGEVERERNASAVAASTEDDVEIRLQPKRPFDTVHKQKLIFNDVIKSLNEEPRLSFGPQKKRPSLNRPQTIDGARKALKHVEPPRSLLPQ